MPKHPSSLWRSQLLQLEQKARILNLEQSMDVLESGLGKGQRALEHVVPLKVREGKENVI